MSELEDMERFARRHGVSVLLAEELFTEEEDDTE